MREFMEAFKPGTYNKRDNRSLIAITIGNKWDKGSPDCRQKLIGIIIPGWGGVPGFILWTKPMRASLQKLSKTMGEQWEVPGWRCLHTQSCFTYTVWTFFCSRVLKFFKPLPFPLKIDFGADFVSVFPLNILLHFETDNTKPKRLLFEKIENI